VVVTDHLVVVVLILILVLVVVIVAIVLLAAPGLLVLVVVRRATIGADLELQAKTAVHPRPLRGLEATMLMLMMTMVAGRDPPAEQEVTMVKAGGGGWVLL